MSYSRNLPHGKCSHAHSKVDIDDISLTLNVFFKSLARDDLLIKSLVSPFTSRISHPSNSISEWYVWNKYRRYSRSHPTKNLSDRPSSCAIASSFWRLVLQKTFEMIFGFLSVSLIFGVKKNRNLLHREEIKRDGEWWYNYSLTRLISPLG